MQRRAAAAVAAAAAMSVATTAAVSAAVSAASNMPYFPGVTDVGIVMPFGGAPGGVDDLGARDTWLFLDLQDPQWPYKMYYDGSGPDAWLACLAVSNDPTLRSWTKLGALLQKGPPGTVDSASASYLTSMWDPITQQWIGYYLGTNQSSPAPGYVPIGPYYTLLATAPSAAGPWTKRSSDATVIPTGSPGVVLNYTQRNGAGQPDEYWQFCTGCMASIGLAVSKNLTGQWTETQALISDPVENTSLYYEEANGLWFLFTNHVGPDQHGMAFDDSIWVYWSTNLTSWPPNQRAVVLNRTNVVEPSFQTGRVGLPSVMVVPGNDKQLAMLYDGGGTPDNVSYNENCSVALAWIDRPLTPPAGYPAL